MRSWIRSGTAFVLLVMLSGCGGESAAEPTIDVGLDRPIGEVVRSARADDARSRPDSATEWWYAAASDPRSGRSFSVAFYSAPYPAIVSTLSTGSHGSRRVEDWRVLSERKGDIRLGIALADGSFRYSKRRREWVVSERAGGYRVRLRFRDGQPGMTVRRPLRVGPESAQWSFLLATAEVDGSIVTPSGERIVIRRWRGYLEHTWGTFSLHSSRFRGWDWAAIHEPNGDAWVVLSVTLFNGDETSMLLRLKDGKRVLCRPRITRRKPVETNVRGVRVPRRIDVRCGRVRGRLYVTQPYVTPVMSSLLGESLARSSRSGSVGMIEHFQTRRPK